MPSYAALLRGIAPTHPNMRNEKFRKMFEGLGFENVRTVISSGNVLFDTPSTAVRALETQIEEAFPRELGFTSTTIIRSKRQLQAFVDADPFDGLEHSKQSSLNVTFFKRRTRTKLKVPFQPEDRDYTFVAMDGLSICSVVDITSSTTPDVMTWVEKQFGKEITTRTYRTVQRILKKLNEPA